MITMANGTPVEWLVACAGLLCMCVGIWLAGHRLGSALIASHFSWAIYLACFTKGDLWWMSGWMWYDRTLELGLISISALWALVYALLIICERFIKDTTEQGAEERSPSEQTDRSESPAIPA